MLQEHRGFDRCAVAANAKELGHPRDDGLQFNVRQFGKIGSAIVSRAARSDSGKLPCP